MILMSQIHLNVNENHSLRLLGTTKVTLSFLKMVKHNFWSVRGYFKKICKKKGKIKRIKKTNV